MSAPDHENLLARRGPAPGAEEQATEPRERLAPDQGVDETDMREMGYAMVDLVVEYLKGLEGRRVYGPGSPSGTGLSRGGRGLRGSCRRASISSSSRAMICFLSAAVRSSRSRALASRRSRRFASLR